MDFKKRTHRFKIELLRYINIKIEVKMIRLIKNCHILSWIFIIATKIYATIFHDRVIIVEILVSGIIQLTIAKENSAGNTFIDSLYIDSMQNNSYNLSDDIKRIVNTYKYPIDDYPELKSKEIISKQSFNVEPEDKMQYDQSVDYMNLNYNTDIIENNIKRINLKNISKLNNNNHDPKYINTVLNDFDTSKYRSNDLQNLPVILSEPESAYVVKNRPAILKCKAAYSLQLYFKCSGRSQPPPSMYEKHVEPHTGVYLLEVTATINRDIVDEYFGKGPFKCECQAWSPRGVTTSQAATISVAYLRKQFIESPTSLLVELGTSAELHCDPPSAVPVPTITWYKNDAIFEQLGNDHGISILSTGILLFKNVSLQDAGNYTCIVENVAGKRTSDAAVLIVYVNGGWSIWGPWSDCNCSDDSISGRKRIRTCNNPSAVNGGTPCSGSSTQLSLDCPLCTDFDLVIYSMLGLITAICLIFGWPLIYFVKYGIDENGHLNIEKSDLGHIQTDKKSTRLHVDINNQSSRINYDFINPVDICPGDDSVKYGVKEHKYDMPTLAINFSNPINEVSVYQMDTESTSTCTSNSTYGVNINLPTVCLSKKVTTDLNKVSETFNFTGGWLRHYNGDITLFIPHNAIGKNQKKHIAVLVLSDDTAHISLPSTNTILVCSTIVQCLPSRHCFLKPVVLKLPHCLTNIHHWNISIYHSVDNQDDINVCWRKITTVGQETINTPIFAHIEKGHVYIMTEQLGRYALVVHPMANISIEKISIKMKLLAFNQATPNNTIMRIYVVRDLPNSKDICARIESSLGGTYLKESTSFDLYLNKRNLKICVQPIDEDSDECMIQIKNEQMQVIPYNHIISNNSILHCEFSLQRRNVKSCDDIGITVNFAQINADDDHTDYLKFVINNKEPSSPVSFKDKETIISFNKQCKYVSQVLQFENSQMHPLTKRKICAALDLPRLDENDWRLLARKLSTDRYIAYFATKPSPTEQILNLLECRTHCSSNTIFELLLHTLKEMNRQDVIDIIQQTIEQHWI